MAVVPIGARLHDGKFIDMVGMRWNGLLGHKRHTVHPVGQLDPVPVYGSGFIRVVVHIDKRRVANRKNERRRRDGAVNRYPSALLTGIIDRAVGSVQVIANGFTTGRAIGKMETGMGSLNSSEERRGGKEWDRTWRTRG